MPLQSPQAPTCMAQLPDPAHLGPQVVQLRDIAFDGGHALLTVGQRHCDVLHRRDGGPDSKREQRCLGRVAQRAEENVRIANHESLILIHYLRSPGKQRTCIPCSTTWAATYFFSTLEASS